MFAIPAIHRLALPLPAWWRPAWAFLAPALFLIVCFFFVPIVAALLLSLTDFDIYAIGAPGVARFLDGLAIRSGGAPIVSVPIAVCLFFMMYPIMVKIDFAEVLKAGKNVKPVTLTLVVNWLIKPFTMYAISLFFLGTLFLRFIGPEATDLVNYFAAKDRVDYPYQYSDRTQENRLADAERQYHSHLFRSLSSQQYRAIAG